MLDHELLKLLHILTHVISPRRENIRSILSIHLVDVFTDLSVVETSNRCVFEILLNRPNLRQIFFCSQNVNGLLWRSPKRAYEILFALIKCVEYFTVGVERVDEVSLRVSINKDKENVYHKNGSELSCDSMINSAQFFFRDSATRGFEMSSTTMRFTERLCVEVRTVRNANRYDVVTIGVLLVLGEQDEEVTISGIRMILDDHRRLFRGLNEPAFVFIDLHTPCMLLEHSLLTERTLILEHTSVVKVIVHLNIRGVNQSRCSSNMLLRDISFTEDIARTKVVEIELIGPCVLPIKIFLTKDVEDLHIMDMCRNEFIRVAEEFPGEKTCSSTFPLNAHVFTRHLIDHRMMINPDEFGLVVDHPGEISSSIGLLRVDREINEDHSIEAVNIGKRIPIVPADQFGIWECHEGNRGGSIAVPINAVIDDTSIHMLCMNFKSSTLPRSLSSWESISHQRVAGAMCR